MQLFTSHPLPVGFHFPSPPSSAFSTFISCLDVSDSERLYVTSWGVAMREMRLVHHRMFVCLSVCLSVCITNRDSALHWLSVLLHTNCKASPHAVIQWGVRTLRMVIRRRMHIRNRSPGESIVGLFVNQIKFDWLITMTSYSKYTCPFCLLPWLWTWCW